MSFSLILLLILLLIAYLPNKPNKKFIHYFSTYISKRTKPITIKRRNLILSKIQYKKKKRRKKKGKKIALI